MADTFTIQYSGRVTPIEEVEDDRQYPPLL